MLCDVILSGVECGLIPEALLTDVLDVSDLPGLGYRRSQRH